MSDTTIRLTREQLYDAIWSKPTTQLAREWGVSDVAVAKWCKKLDIPKPKPGYWQSLQAGRQAEKLPLPDAQGREASYAVIDIPSARPVLILGEAAERRIQLATDPVNKISVTMNLRKAHPLVRSTREALEHGRTDEYGRLCRVTSGDCLDVRVSKSSLRRALLLMDAFVKAVEAGGYVVETTAGTHIVSEGERVKICLWERMIRSEKQLGPQDRRSWSSSPWTYAPSGTLSFVIEEHVSDTLRKRWTDGKPGPLEDQLNRTLAGVLTIAEAKRLKRIEQEAEARRRQEEARRRAEQERLRIEEEARIQALESAADAWTKSQNLRAFLAVCESRIRPEMGSDDEDRPEVRWLAWAHRRADQIDPFRNGCLEALMHRLPAKREA